jgi:hypothetical protein
MFTNCKESSPLSFSLKREIDPLRWKAGGEFMNILITKGLPAAIPFE